MANRWSHAAGKTSPQVVPSTWQTTAGWKHECGDRLDTRFHFQEGTHGTMQDGYADLRALFINCTLKRSPIENRSRRNRRREGRRSSGSNFVPRAITCRPTELALPAGSTGHISFSWSISTMAFGRTHWLASRAADLFGCAHHRDSRRRTRVVVERREHQAGGAHVTSDDFRAGLAAMQPALSRTP